MLSKDAKRKTHLKVLNDVSMNLQGLLKSENFYQDIVDILRDKLEYYAIQFWKVGSDKSTTLLAQSGAFESALEIGHRNPAEAGGITGIAIKNNETYLANEVENDPNYTTLSLPSNCKSQITVPIRQNGEIIAVLNIESDQVDAFDQEDVMTLEGLASQIDLAISNRNLFKGVDDFNQKLQEAVKIKTEELRKAHHRILEQQKLLQKENKALKTIFKKENTEHGIIGSSPAILGTLSMVDKIAPTLASVLIQGESGTGKELIARRLHFKSDRSDKPYVTVNCGALQENLLESELFGHEKGAFTGAVQQKIGLVETADGGTLFLDEIGEMPLTIQTKLLRFLQEGEFYRIGGKRALKVDVRVISATNRDLELEVKESRFREDLFYRLNTITLRMPPLRKRREDIPRLVDHFLKNSRFGGPNKEIKRVDQKVLSVFKNYEWPGNIRELQNTVERLKILSDNNEITLDDLPFNIRMPTKTKLEKGGEFNVNMPLEELEKTHILRTLAYYHGNKTKTAQCLGVTIKTLYNKLHRYGVIQKNTDSRTQGETI